MLSLLRALVQSLVRELRSCKLRGEAKKEKKKKKKRIRNHHKSLSQDLILILCINLLWVEL